MAMDMDGIRARMGTLRAGYLAGLPGRLAGIRLGLDMQRQVYDRAAWTDLHRQVHSLIGSGGTFGLPDLSTAARDLEIPLREVMEGRQSPGKADFPELDRLLAVLEVLAGQATAGQPPAWPQTPTGSVPDTHAGPSVPDIPAVHGGFRLCLFGDDTRSVTTLTRGLVAYGCEVASFRQPEEFLAWLGRESWGGCLLMAGDGPPRPELLDVAARAKAGPAADMPLVLACGDDSLAARLDAAKAGVDIFMRLPVDANLLMDRLSESESSQGCQPFSILIVDDEPAVAESHAAILREAGMLAEVVASPLDAPAAMRDFAPDLILLDLYMPGCTGVELAKVIRQYEEFLGIPIVFLSGEYEIDRQLAALSQGGDDFLTKPIKPEHLISAVRSRVRRYRVLRSLMTHDGLTGLLNHSSLRTRLETEVLRCARTGCHLSFAMIDLDHFKVVNDTYGHPAGDMVLRTLARLLSLRLRRTDVIGRLGGEEFGVVMPETPPSDAKRVMDQLREAFHAIVHRHGDQEFQVSLSSGLASYPVYPDQTSLVRAADRALYEAKSLGRNRVVTSPGC